MKNLLETEQRIGMNINSESILFFDLDGTLVDTNIANYLSYKDAIEHLIPDGLPSTYNLPERFTRSTLRKVMPYLTDLDFNAIVKLKDEKFKDYLHETKLNNSVAEILIKYSKPNKTVLVTNCRKERALQTLNHHGLTNYISAFFFKQNETNGRINKFKSAIESMKIPPELIFVFENEISEVQDAVIAGIPQNQIIYSTP